MTFENLGLSTELLRAVSDQGYNSPTPIQQKAIPEILQGRDILAGAQTGTGKTAGFTLPILEMLIASPREENTSHVRVLILTPTRELAAQVAESVETYSQHIELKTAVVFGGVKINPQIAKLKSGVDILIATPGRLLDHAQQKTVDLSKVEVLVLDEADRMLDMGFINDIKKIMALLPENADRQNLLFSATFSADIKALADSLLDSPALIEVAKRNEASELVDQIVYPVDKRRKRELLSYTIGSNNWQQVLVFTRTKHGANRLVKQLELDGIKSSAIHGNKSQGARTKALREFKEGQIRVLVATDIAARGLDIDQLPHVVNYELPNIAEDYVHRIGRTGRAGNEGQAVSLICVDELPLLKEIEKLLGRSLPTLVIEGFEPDPTIKAEPIQKQRNNNRGQKKPRNNNTARGNRDNRGGRGRNNSGKSRTQPRSNSQNKRQSEHRYQGVYVNTPSDFNSEPEVEVDGNRRDIDTSYGLPGSNRNNANNKKNSANKNRNRRKGKPGSGQRSRSGNGNRGGNGNSFGSTTGNPYYDQLTSHGRNKSGNRQSTSGDDDNRGNC